MYLLRYLLISMLYRKKVTIFISNSEENENVFQLRMDKKYFKGGGVRVCHSLSSNVSYVLYSQFKLVLFKSSYNKQTWPFSWKSVIKIRFLDIFSPSRKICVSDEIKSKIILEYMKVRAQLCSLEFLFQLQLNSKRNLYFFIWNWNRPTVSLSISIWKSICCNVVYAIFQFPSAAFHCIFLWVTA